MTNHNAGSATLLIIVASIGLLLLIAAFHYIHAKQLLKVQLTNRVLLIWGIISLLVFIFFRWIWSIIDWVQNNNYSLPLNIVWSRNFSQVLLLDLCPFLAVALPLSYVIKSIRRFSLDLAIIAIFSGSSTIIGSLYLKETEFSLNYIFIGILPNRLFFLLHYNLVLYGVSILLCHPKPFHAGKLVEIIYPGVAYLTYVVIISKIFNVQFNVTGTSVYDWNNSYGEYYQLGQILAVEFPATFWLGLLFCSFMAWIVIGLHNMRYYFIKVIYQHLNYNLFMTANTKSESPIAHLVSNINQTLPHWEGQLSFKQFWTAYWHLVWTNTTWVSKVTFISCGFIIFYFPSVLLQFLFKKIYYCWKVKKGQKLPVKNHQIVIKPTYQRHRIGVRHRSK